MFILPNDKQIDYEAVIDAMLDSAEEHIYRLDCETGECGSEIKLIKEIGKAKFDAGQNSKYFQVPKITDFERLRWIESYITGVVEDEDKIFAEKLRNILVEENPYDNFIKTLEESKDGWIYGWNSWEGDSAFEEMKQWFARLPFEIREEMDCFDGDCPICRAMEEDRISEEELKDAFREANFNNVLEDIYKDGENQINKLKLTRWLNC